MIRILRVILAAAIVLAIAWAIAALPGRFTVEWGNTTLEASSSIAVLGLLILIVVVYAIVRLLALVWRSPRSIGRARAERRRRLGDRAVSNTLTAIAAGDGDDARRAAGRSRRLLGETPQTLLLEAESSRLADRQQDAETIYRKMAERPDAAFLGYRGLLRLAIEKQDWAEAAAIARQADAARPGALWVRRERAMLAIRAGNWTEALELSDAEAPRAALATGAAMAETDPAQALRLARTAWKRDPALAPAALAYVERLRSMGRPGRAEAVLRQSWTAQPHPDLAVAAMAPFADAMSRLNAARLLIQKRPDHPESHMLLARVCMDSGQVADAREHLEKVRAAGVDSRRMWLLLAEIEEDERGNTEDGRHAVRSALRHAADVGADEGWRCDNCHTPQPRWSPACPVCATAGGLRWVAANEATASAPARLQLQSEAEVLPAR